MKKILFPTDFSENASKALPFALGLAEKTDAQLLVLHTYQMPYHRADTFMSIMDIMKNDAEVAIAKEIAAIKATPAGGMLHIEPIVRVGDLADTIVDLTREMHVDLVVMGTSGATGLEEVFLGSNAASAINKSIVPVLCIPPQASWKEPKTILFPFDLKETNPDAILLLKQVCQLYGSSLKVLNVQEDPAEASTKEAGAAVNLERLLEGIPHDYFLSRNSDVEEAIFEFNEKWNPDWIAMVHHNQGFFERLFGSSLTKKVAYHTNVPLLALNEPKTD